MSKSYSYPSLGSTTTINPPVTPPPSLVESVSNICEAVSTYIVIFISSQLPKRRTFKATPVFSVSNLNFVFQVQEIGDTTLTLTSPSDLNDPNLAPPVALQIAARLNLIENAINDLRTPNCN